MPQKHNNILVLLSIISALSGFIVKLFYRPFIVENNINDLGFHNYAPNLFYALGICLIIPMFVQKRPIRTMIFATIGILAYELDQIWTSRTFDFQDIIATLVGLGIAVLIFNRFDSKADSEDNNETIRE